MGNHAIDVGMKLGLARGLGPGQRSATWLLLKHYNDMTGYCCPKIATLADAEGIDESAMGRTLFRLMENSCWERRMVGILYHYDLPPAIASTIVAAKTAHEAGVIFDIESHYHGELARLGPATKRPHFGSIEHLNTDHGVNDTDHGVNDTDHGVNDTDHGDRSERRKKEVRKDFRKEVSPPRPALVPVATLTAPETAAAVFNTLEIPAKEPDMLSLREKEIRKILYHGIENDLQLDDDRRDELCREIFYIAKRERLKEEEDDDDNDDRRGDEALQLLPDQERSEPVLRHAAIPGRPSEPLQGVQHRKAAPEKLSPAADLTAR